MNTKFTIREAAAVLIATGTVMMQNDVCCSSARSNNFDGDLSRILMENGVDGARVPYLLELCLSSIVEFDPVHSEDEDEDEDEDAAAGDYSTSSKPKKSPTVDATAENADLFADDDDDEFYHDGYASTDQARAMREQLKQLVRDVFNTEYDEASRTQIASFYEANIEAMAEAMPGVIHMKFLLALKRLKQKDVSRLSEALCGAAQFFHIAVPVAPKKRKSTKKIQKAN